jgi:hypothetical protein
MIYREDANLLVYHSRWRMENISAKILFIALSEVADR